MLKTSRFNTREQLVALYKARLLSFIECRTVAIHHACDSVLEVMDGGQDKLLKAVGASEAEAVITFKLVPLSSWCL